MKLFRINEHDWYAGRSEDEAVAAAMKDTGLPRDEIIDEEFLQENDPQKILVTVEESPHHIALDLRRVVDALSPWESMFKSDIETLRKGADELLSKCQIPASEIVAKMEDPGLVCSTQI